MPIDTARPNRRHMIAGGAALLAAGGVARGATPGTIRLVVGTYAREGGGGLYPVDYSVAEHRWQVGTPIAAAPDASFGVRARRSGRRYLLEEATVGHAALWSGGRRIARFATLGADPCHAALDARETSLAIANYSSGSVAFYRLDPKTGVPLGTPTIRTATGHGPNPARQEAPHAHWVGFAPDGRWLHSVDLGTDAILAYPFDVVKGMLGETRLAYRAPAGSGPRHLAWHPRQPRAYLVSELANSVTVLRPAPDGRFTALQTLSTLPAGHNAASQAAHIAIDRAGRTLYVSNRGHDSIAVYAIAPDGRLALRQIVSTGGSWPRFFLLADAARRLIVANERAGTLAAFAVGADGRLTPLPGTARVPGAVFLDYA